MVTHVKFADLSAKAQKHIDTVRSIMKTNGAKPLSKKDMYVEKGIINIEGWIIEKLGDANVDNVFCVILSVNKNRGEINLSDIDIQLNAGTRDLKTKELDVHDSENDSLAPYSIALVKKWIKNFKKGLNMP